MVFTFFLCLLILFFFLSSIVTFGTNLFILFHLTSSLSLSLSLSFLYSSWTEQKVRNAYLFEYVCACVVHKREKRHRCVLLQGALLRKKARIIACSCTPLNATRRRWWWRHTRLQYRSNEGEYKSIFVWLQTSSFM